MTAESHSWDFLSHVADLFAVGFFNPMSRVFNVVGLTIPSKSILYLKISRRTTITSFMSIKALQNLIFYFICALGCTLSLTGCFMTTIGDSTPYCTVALGLCTRFEPPTKIGFFEKCLVEGCTACLKYFKLFLKKEMEASRQTATRGMTRCRPCLLEFSSASFS